MLRDGNSRSVFSGAALLVIVIATGFSPTASWSSALPAQAKNLVIQADVLAGKSISPKALEKYKQTSVKVEKDGKEETYSGVALRELLVDMVPELKIEKMPEWKALSRKEIVMEFVGDDGYPGLVTAIEIAINKEGDRFVLATQCDGKPLESGPTLICKMDQARTRWVRNVVKVRVVALADDTVRK